jgi:predicted ATP-grasp superfamily ATP-dependent carboligase
LFADSDFFVTFIATHREALAAHYLFNVTDDLTLQLITNKYQTDRVARAAGVRTPSTLKLSASDSAAAVADAIGFPCIIKPQDSFSRPFPGKNQIANDATELDAFLHRYPELKEHVILQEIIPGRESNIFQCTGYVGRHTPTRLFTMQKIHQYPPGYGTTALGRSASIPALIASTERLLKHIGYTGFASVEYKRSDKDDQFYLIEINPRLPWYNALFLTCGTNFPYLAYADLKQLPIGAMEPIEPADDVVWVHFWNVVAGLWKKKNAGLALDLTETVSVISRARSFACFDPHDLKPFYKANMEYVRRAFAKRLHRKNAGEPG